MPLLLRKTIADDVEIGIWKVLESERWFRSQLQLDAKELQFIDSIRHAPQRLHWLSSRWLLRLLLGNPAEFIRLEGDGSGRPVVHNFPVNISISHSHGFSALMLSHHYQVGIDIELIDERVERISKKFMRLQELQDAGGSSCLLEQLHVYWCAKEAMYKWYGKKQLDFREHLSVQRFQCAAAGEMLGNIHKGELRVQLPLQFEKIESCMMACTYAVQPT